MKKSLIVTVVLLLALFISYKAASSQLPQSNMSRASDFSLKDIDGNTVSLSDFEGQGVILFFWTTWCPHCRARIAEFNRKYQEMLDSGIQLISIDVGEPENRVKGFTEKYSLGYPVLLDYNSRVAQQYGLRGVPTIILISKERTILLIAHHLPANYKEYFSENGT